MNSGSLANWTFDAYVSYSKSAGYSARYGIGEIGLIWH